MEHRNKGGGVAMREVWQVRLESKPKTLIKGLQIGVFWECFRGMQTYSANVVRFAEVLISLSHERRGIYRDSFFFIPKFNLFIPLIIPRLVLLMLN